MEKKLLLLIIIKNTTGEKCNQAIHFETLDIALRIASDKLDPKRLSKESTH